MAACGSRHAPATRSVRSAERHSALASDRHRCLSRASKSALARIHDTVFFLEKRMLESAAMRRLVALFLLILLPLQFSWALAAAYCQHEAAPSTQHFGHHDHRHDAHVAADSTPETKLPGAADNDCSVCHTGCVAALLDTATPSVAASVSVVADLLPAPPAAVPAPRPERPNWHRLA